MTVVNHVEQITVTDVSQTLAVIHAPAAQGAPGPRGQPGPAAGSAFTRLAGESLSALLAVYELPSGQVYALDAADADHIDMLVGITTTAATAGAEVTIQRAGPLDATGLGLQPGRVWLGAGGRLTQIPPESGFDILLGYATADQRIYLDPQPAIIIED